MHKEVDILLFLQYSRKIFEKSPEKDEENITVGETSYMKPKPIERKNKKKFEDEILLVGCFLKTSLIHCIENHEKKIKVREAI